MSYIPDRSERYNFIYRGPAPIPLPEKEKNMPGFNFGMPSQNKGRQDSETSNRINNIAKAAKEMASSVKNNNVNVNASAFRRSIAEVTENGVRLTIERLPCGMGSTASFAESGSFGSSTKRQYKYRVRETEEIFSLEMDIDPEEGYWLWRHTQQDLPSVQDRINNAAVKRYNDSLCEGHARDISLNFIESGEKYKLNPLCAKCNRDIFSSAYVLFVNF